MRIDFPREAFAGCKNLLKLSKIHEVWEAPKFKEISAKRIQVDVKKEADLMKYFPGYTDKNRPSKKCLLTVKF